MENPSLHMANPQSKHTSKLLSKRQIVSPVSTSTERKECTDLMYSGDLGQTQLTITNAQSFL